LEIARNWVEGKEYRVRYLAGGTAFKKSLMIGDPITSKKARAKYLSEILLWGADDARSFGEKPIRREGEKLGAFRWPC